MVVSSCDVPGSTLDDRLKVNGKHYAQLKESLLLKVGLYLLLNFLNERMPLLTLRSGGRKRRQWE